MKSMEEEVKIPTSEDIVVKQEFSAKGFESTLFSIACLIIGFFAYKHFIAKQSGYLSISIIDNRNAFADLLYIFFAGILVYIIFLIYGIVLSIISSKTKCDKIDYGVSAGIAARYSFYPMMFYMFIRLVEPIRVSFQKVIGSVFEKPFWSIALFMLMFTVTHSIELVSESEQKACVSSEEEARKYKEKFLKDIKDKQSNGK